MSAEIRSLSWPAACGASALLLLGALAALSAGEVGRAPDDLDELELRKSLAAQARELDLDAEKGARGALVEVSKKHAARVSQARRDGETPPGVSAPVESLLAARADLRGLPLLRGKACETHKDQASRVDKVRIMLAGTNAKIEQSKHPRREAVNSLKYHRNVLQRGGPIIGPLEQAYQAEPEVIRAAVIEALAESADADVTRALARRAAFDVSEVVREAAVEALKLRPAAEVRPVLLAAMRHPWAPAANHAARALVALDDVEAVDELKRLRDQPDPAAPVETKQGKWVIDELVRVNHLRNCLLCHPVSHDEKDPLRAAVPVPGEPLPQVYYRDNDRKLLRVRADVVYLRQDFSVVHAVENAGKWPRQQRFDYLVQTRELAGAELETAQQKAKSAPRRDVVRWALTRLAGDGKQR